MRSIVISGVRTYEHKRVGSRSVMRSLKSGSISITVKPDNFGRVASLKLTLKFDSSIYSLLVFFNNLIIGFCNNMSDNKMISIHFKNIEILI